MADMKQIREFAVKWYDKFSDKKSPPTPEKFTAPMSWKSKQAPMDSRVATVVTAAEPTSALRIWVLPISVLIPWGETVMRVLNYSSAATVNWRP